MDVGIERTVCLVGFRAGTLNCSLKRGKKLLSTLLASAMVEAPARRSSVTNLSWKVPAIRSTRPLACGERARMSSMPVSSMAQVS